MSGYISIEDIEMRWRNIPRIKKVWFVIRRQVFRVMDFPYHISRVRWFIQRGKRGWADCDWWNMDAYLVEIILPMLKHLKENEIGYPGYGKASTPKKWGALLDEMIEGFEIAKKITDDNYDPRTYIVDLKTDKKLFEKKAKIFITWFFHLWD